MQVPAEPTNNIPPQPIYNVMNTCQTDSEPVTAEKARAEEIPEPPKPIQSTKGPDAPTTDHPLAPSVAAFEPEAPAAAEKVPEPTKEAPRLVAGGPKPDIEAPIPVTEPSQPVEQATKPAEEPQVGEKRDLDSMANQTSSHGQISAPEPAAEKVEEPESKKQKTELEPAKETNGTASAKPAEPAPTSTSSAPAAEAPEKPTKAGRSKKEKIKEAVKKVLSTDGPGSRTRSRTKDT